jgi:predicted RNase H-like HicB family nuclease
MQITAMFQRDGEWWVAWAAEVPAAMTQGATLDEARENLIDAVREVLAEAREAAQRSAGPEIVQETIEVGA